MMRTWFLIYNYLILPVLYTALYLLGFFNDKIKRGMKARKTLLEDIEVKLKKIDRSKKQFGFTHLQWVNLSRQNQLLKK